MMTTATDKLLLPKRILLCQNPHVTEYNWWTLFKIFYMKIISLHVMLSMPTFYKIRCHGHKDLLVVNSVEM
jgi:hypothetical protein